MGRQGHPFLAGSPSLPQLNDSALALRRLAGVALESLENDLVRCRSPSVAKRVATRVVIDFICWWRPHAIPPTQRGASVAHLGGPIDVRTAGAATPQADMTYPPSRSGESVANAADTSLELLGNSGRFREALGKPAGSRPEAFGKPSGSLNARLPLWRRAFSSTQITSWL